MGRAMRSLFVASLGAAAYSMRDRRTRKRFMKMIQPITNGNVEELMPKRSTVRKMRKRLTKTFA
ncbi:hypothetical protein [Bacillus sp. FJAT-45350]|uniref:hypothetical protein n=1 Tax=Bacillus sp. FJAT-45350 TaxID=2011014 RepID=UPI000BB67F19|nr:hypothetical protein [Bacillus sp. FJAT-45350]